MAVSSHMSFVWMQLTGGSASTIYSEWSRVPVIDYLDRLDLGITQTVIALRL